MIQDIYPSRLKNEYVKCEIKDNDTLLIFDRDGRLSVSEKDGVMRFPVWGDVKDLKEISSDEEIRNEKPVYLFSIDEQKFFLSLSLSDYEKDGFVFHTIREVRDLFSGNGVYAAFTAYHLWKWYSDNKFCGKCASKLVISEKERALVCPDCGNTIYPRINPAVIVGVIKGDSILITKYNRGYAHSALVAGFTEIGETLEETVAREVMEETGIKVKNIRYYKSQPWGMAQDMLVGFYCDADGDCEIHMDKNELKYAEWVKREDIELQPNNLSLTNEMMRMFKESRI